MLRPVQAIPRNPGHRHDPPPELNWWVNPCPDALLAPACPNAKVVQADLELPPDRVVQECLPAAAIPWNWSASRSVETGAPPAVAVLAHPPALGLLDVPAACPLVCANR